MNDAVVMLLLGEYREFRRPRHLAQSLRNGIAAIVRPMALSRKSEKKLPPGFILLPKAVLLGWAVQWDNVTFGIERAERRFGRPLADHIGRLRLVSDFDTLDKSDLEISINEKLATANRPDEAPVELWKLPFWPNAFAHELRTVLLSKRLEGFVFDQKLNTIPIAEDYWKNEHCLDALLRGSPVRVPNKGIESPVVIRLSDLKAYLTPPEQLHPLARASLTWEAVQHVSTTWQMQTNKVSSEPPSQPTGTSEPKQSEGRKTRHQPQRAAAILALNALYPNGAPTREEVDDASLSEAVNRYLKADKRRQVSHWTVMRAAGRRS